MRRLTSLLACLMMLLTTLAGPAHAVQLAACSEPIAAEMVMHVSGDCDEVQADEHKSYPHHHDGCHGQHVAAPVDIGGLAEPMIAERSYGTALATTFVGHRSDTTLRPPRA